MGIDNLQAINTYYDGNLFRSRLEARWAVFFKSLGLPYEYEKEGYILKGLKYLPDFWLPQQDFWIEIKGIYPTDDEIEKAERLVEESGKRVYVFFGQIPNPDSFYSGDSAFAYLPANSPDGIVADFDHGYKWCECPDCGLVGIQYDGRADRLSCKVCWHCGILTMDDEHEAELTEEYKNLLRNGCPVHGMDFNPSGCPRHGGNRDLGHNYASRRLLEAYRAARTARFEFNSAVAL